jgi:succinoglycan biosynthesis protein ExoM
MLIPVTEERTSIAVCVCTCRRPDELRRLLERLIAVAAHVHERASTTVVVVDDDPALTAQPVLDDYVDRFEGGLHRAATGSGNISLARNTAIESGAVRADWVAMIDDDCLPDVSWLSALLEVRDSTGANGVSGRCEDQPPPGAPRWIVDEPFLDGPTAGSNGAEIEIGALKNTMVSSAFLDSSGVRFDEEWGRVGGEDVMFFNACRAGGMRLVFASDAVVRERVPHERARLSYQLRRRWWYGNTEALTSIATGRSGRARAFAGGVKCAVSAIAGPPTDLLRRRRLRWRYSLSELLRGVGRMMGALGVRVPHH